MSTVALSSAFLHNQRCVEYAFFRVYSLPTIVTIVWCEEILIYMRNVLEGAWALLKQFPLFLIITIFRNNQITGYP